MGGVFCKKWTFPQHRVHYVQYQYFLFYILLIWEGAYATNAPPMPMGLNTPTKILSLLSHAAHIFVL